MDEAKLPLYIITQSNFQMHYGIAMLEVKLGGYI